MAALLVAISIMAIMLGAALPTWSMMIRREKEEELIFRGQQYARAIRMYGQKYANAAPQDLDVLVKERFLRKKFKDPLSPNKDGAFQTCHLQGPNLGPGQNPPQRQGTSGSGQQQQQQKQQQQQQQQSGRANGPQPGTAEPSAAPQNCEAGGRGPITGIASKNTGTSIRTFNGKTRYSEWRFEAVSQTMQAGGGPGGGPPGSRQGDPRGSRSGSQGMRGGTNSQSPSRSGFSGTQGGSPIRQQQQPPFSPTPR
jgi:type II secretory pathway pseudopilin PulG